MSAHGTQRPIAALQYSGRCWGHSGHRAARTRNGPVAIDPKATLAKSEAASALVHRTLLGATALAKINDWLSLCFAYSDTGKIGAEMISDPGARKEEICPVSDDLLGALYRSDKKGIVDLVETVS